MLTTWFAVRTNIVPIVKCLTGDMDYLDEFEDEYEYATTHPLVPAPQLHHTHRIAHAEPGEGNEGTGQQMLTVASMLMVAALLAVAAA